MEAEWRSSARFLTPDSKERDLVHLVFAFTDWWFTALEFVKRHYTEDMGVSVGPKCCDKLVMTNQMF